jgi:hypothetical protein
MINCAETLSQLLHRAWPDDRSRDGSIVSLAIALSDETLRHLDEIWPGARGRSTQSLRLVEGKI